MDEHVLEEGMGLGLFHRNISKLKKEKREDSANMLISICIFAIYDCPPLGVSYWDKFTLDT